MSKARKLIEEELSSELTLSSGVAVTILPFPSQLYPKLNARALAEHPDPEPPMKTVEVVDGTEEVPDEENEEYQEALREARNARQSLLLEAILDFCVEVDMDQWGDELARLERYVGEMPEDPVDRKIEFLNQFAMRTRGDYELVATTATAQMMAGSPEVAERLKSFRGEMAQPAGDDADAPGVDAE
jgi:NADH:ubiquinone oxidoreductase subunit E